MKLVLVKRCSTCNYYKSKKKKKKIQEKLYRMNLWSVEVGEEGVPCIQKHKKKSSVGGVEG